MYNFFGRLSCSFYGAKPSKIEREVILHANDILFIIAAGNHALDLERKPMYPACYYLDNCIVVAAMDRYGKLEKTSNYGGPVDIVAPGSEIFTTSYNYTYTLVSGTSIAAPFVTAICSLIWSLEQNLTPSELKKRVVNVNNVTQIDCLKDKVASGGLLNAYKTIISSKK